MKLENKKNGSNAGWIAGLLFVVLLHYWQIDRDLRWALMVLFVVLAAILPKFWSYSRSRTFWLVTAALIVTHAFCWILVVKLLKVHVGNAGELAAFIPIVLEGLAFSMLLKRTLNPIPST